MTIICSLHLFPNYVSDWSIDQVSRSAGLKSQWSLTKCRYIFHSAVINNDFHAGHFIVLFLLSDGEILFQCACTRLIDTSSVLLTILDHNMAILNQSIWANISNLQVLVTPRLQTMLNGAGSPMKKKSPSPTKSHLALTKMTAVLLSEYARILK